MTNSGKISRCKGDLSFGEDPRSVAPEYQVAYIGLGSLQVSQQRFSSPTSMSNFFEQILDSMADPLMVVNQSGMIDVVNAAATEVLGFAKEELCGKSLQFIFPPDEALQIVDGASGGATAQSWSVQVSCRRHDGSVMPVLFSCSRLEGDGRMAGRIVLIGRDIREMLAVREEIERLHEQNVYLNEQLRTDHNFEHIVASSPVMKSLFRRVRKVAATDATVLLRGETGTGKELLARAIHNLSPRKDKPLIKVNCAVLPAGLVESELFGHEKGAFTGAVAKRLGRFELADTGTIFLDEIGELPLETQAKLLRVLQEQQLERVGGTRTITTDVRVIAATNRNLEEEIGQGVFREDLFYRLNVFPLFVPPLRDRADDIPLLANYFVEKFAAKANRQIRGVSKEAIALIERYEWPGNVRELANVLERAVILCESRVLGKNDLQILRIGKPRKTPVRLDEVQRRHIVAVLNECGGVIGGPQGAATRLGLHPATLRSRMAKLGIVREASRFVAHPKR